MEKGLRSATKRIAILGPECSGKTTLCAQLKTEMPHVQVVEEYAREYLTIHGSEYDIVDLQLIAHVQAERNKSAMGQVIVCDTEMITMLIWAEERFGIIPQRLLVLASEQQFDHYLLCTPEMPWEIDPLRENELDRLRLFRIYEECLRSRVLDYTIVEGSREERLSIVRELIT